MMHIRKQKGSEVQKIYSYNSIKQQLENENAQLLHQRQQINQELQTLAANPAIEVVMPEPAHVTSFPTVANLTPGHHQPHGSTVDLLRNKIQEIIEICEAEGEGDQGTVAQVASAEKYILKTLGKEGQEGRTSRRKEKPSQSRSFNQGYGVVMGDEAMSMLEEIERKALLEIESLRNDKILLMKKLNDEIKVHNEEKKLRIAVQQQLRAQQFRPQKIESNQIIEDERGQSTKGQGSPYFPTFNNPQPAFRPQAYPTKPAFQHETHLAFTPQAQPLLSPQAKPHSPKVHPQLFTHHKRNPTPQQLPLTTSVAPQLHSHLTFSPKPDSSDLKQKLRLQVRNLSSKIHSYQGLLSQTKRTNHSSFNEREFQSLIVEGNELNQNASKLLNRNLTQCPNVSVQEHEPRANTEREHPVQYEQSANVGRPEGRPVTNYVNRNNSQRATFDYYRPELQTFSPMDRANFSQVSNNKGFSPSQYEELINEMRSVTSR